MGLTEFQSPATGESTGYLQRSDTGSFGQRALGRIIDYVLAMGTGFVGGMVAAIVLIILAAKGRVGHDWADQMGQAGFGFDVVVGLISGIIGHSVGEAIAGTSVGKLILGLRVVDENLEPVGPIAAFQRNLAYVVDAFFFGAPANSSMAGSPLNQRIGDKWARTIVAKSAVLPARSRRPAGLIAIGLFASVMVQALIVGILIVLSVH